MIGAESSEDPLLSLQRPKYEPVSDGRGEVTFALRGARSQNTIKEGKVRESRIFGGRRALNV